MKRSSQVGINIKHQNVVQHASFYISSLRLLKERGDRSLVPTEHDYGYYHYWNNEIRLKLIRWLTEFSPSRRSTHQTSPTIRIGIEEIVRINLCQDSEWYLAELHCILSSIFIVCSASFYSDQLVSYPFQTHWYGISYSLTIRCIPPHSALWCVLAILATIFDHA